MARINFPIISSIGQSFSDHNNTVWIVDNRYRWVRNSRSAGLPAQPAPGDVIYYASSEVDQFALASKQGDICIRTDEVPNGAYKQKSNANGVPSNWQRLGLVGSNYGKL